MNRPFQTLAPATLFALLSLLAGTAAAHTGHGHDSLNFMQGLRHALGEPDHLLMLAFGFGLASMAAQRVLRGLQRLRQAWQDRRQARQAAAHDISR